MALDVLEYVMRGVAGMAVDVAGVSTAGALVDSTSGTDGSTGSGVATGAVLSTTEEELSATGAALSITGDELSTAFGVETGVACATGAADLEDEATAAPPLPPAALGALESSALVQPLLAVMAAGHATCLKETVGLSAPLNQSKRQLQPAWRAAGKPEHEDDEEMPPYCAPQPEDGAPHSCVQPLKIPTPPPGMLMSNWLPARSPPVLVACTIILFPATGPLVKVNS